MSLPQAVKRISNNSIPSPAKQAVIPAACFSTQYFPHGCQELRIAVFTAMRNLFIYSSIILPFRKRHSIRLRFFCAGACKSIQSNQSSFRYGAADDDYIMVSSSRKSTSPTFRIPLSLYHRLRISLRTIIFGNESPVSENGFNSCSVFSSSGRAKAD